MKPIGKVSHYYSKAGVAIVELQDALKIGERIRIERGEKKGDSVGIKVDQKAKEGSLVVLLEEGE
jgi:hypothetical protein